MFFRFRSIGNPATGEGDAEQRSSTGELGSKGCIKNPAKPQRTLPCLHPPPSPKTIDQIDPRPCSVVSEANSVLSRERGAGVPVGSGVLGVWPSSRETEHDAVAAA